MTNQIAFKKALRGSDPTLKLRDVVVALRAEGIAKKDIIDELYALRREVEQESETDEDVILEVLDFLTGFCSPHMYID